MGTISEHFSYKEFEESKIARQYKICNAITSVRVRDAIYALVHNVLQPLRYAWGRPLKVNSGYRCPELNSHFAIGGSPTSQHVKGEAADISTNAPYELAKLARDMQLPYDQMILYPTFVHFSHKPEGEQRQRILYNKSYQGKKLT